VRGEKSERSIMLKWHLMLLSSIYCAVFLTIHSLTIPDMHMILSILFPWSSCKEFQ
jgi:hypothetical protein